MVFADDAVRALLTAVRGVGDRSGAHGEDFEPADPVKGKLGLEYGGVGAFLGALSDGSSSAVDPRPNRRW